MFGITLVVGTFSHTPFWRHYRKLTVFRCLELFSAVYVGHQKLYLIFGGPFTTTKNLRENRRK
jgi:hypothetical protein